MAALGGADRPPAHRRRARRRRAPRMARGAACGHAVAARRDADDRVAHAQREWPGGWLRADRRRSSAGPAISAARPCSQTPAQAASKPAGPAPEAPRSFLQGHRRYRHSPAMPAPAARSRAARPEKRRACPAPCRPRPRRDAGGFQRAVGLRPGQIAEQLRNSPSCGVTIASWPLQPLGLAEMGDAVGIHDLRRTRGQRQRQHLRNVAHSRGRPAGSRSARHSPGALSIWTTASGKPAIGFEVLTRT